MRTLLEGPNRSRFHLPLLVGLYLALFAVAAWVISTTPQERITEILKTWIPWNLKLNLLVLLGASIACFGDILAAVRRFADRRGALLVALTLAGFVMTCFVAERTHRIYYDEDIYANVGQNIATVNQTGLCNYGGFEYGEYHPHWIEYNKEPSGWPFLISLTFQALGTNELYAFLLNNLLFAGGILLVFLISWELTASAFTSFLAALIFSLIPHNLIWCNTAAAEPSAAFFSGLVVFVLLVYMRTHRVRHLFLLAAVLPLASQMRPESLLIFFWALLVVLIFQRKTLLSSTTWALGLIASVFLLPHFLHFYALAGHSWGADGPKFAWDFFLPNLKVNGLYYLLNMEFPVVFTLLALAGLLGARVVSLTWRLLMLLWFLFFWGIFLFFYAGSYHYGADVRFALLAFMPVAILAGFGGTFVRDTLSRFTAETVASSLVVALVAASFVGFLTLVRMEGQEAWGARYDHKYAKQFIEALPPRSLVFTQVPTMLLLWGQSAIQTYVALNQPELVEQLMEKYHGQLYFHVNFWCNTESKEHVRLCEAVVQQYVLEEVIHAKEQTYEYGLYRMSFR